MNKKIFIKNKPFDVNDANDMQNWTEDALKKTMASIYSSGIVEGLNVVQKTGMQVTVNLGKAFNSNYDFINVTSNQTVTIAAANATNPRIDKIFISYLSSTTNNTDTANTYGMGTSFIYSQNKLDSFQIQYVQGTPAASPVGPATPTGALVLAQVYVAANATSITTTNITDLRQFITINSNINRPLVIFASSAPTDTNTVWVDTTINKAKIYYNNTWNIIDAKDADTLDGQHGSYYSPATHNHDTVYYTKSLTYSKTESDTNFLKKTDNLSTLSDVATARTNLGLGTAATSNTTAFAPAVHNHDTSYVKGNYKLTIGTTAPASPTTADIWWDTNSSSNIIKRWDGTSWVQLDANDANTLTGLSPGTGANNLLKLDSSGKVPYTNLPLTDSYTSTSTTSAATANSAKLAYDNALVWAKGFGLGTVAKSISSSDLNTLAAESGFYRGQLLTNAPGGSTGWFYIIQLVSAATYITQIAINFVTSGAGKEYRRQNNNGTWSAWEESITSTRTISVGTGLTGGGDLSTDRTISFDTTWGDGRYARKDTGSFTAQISTTRTGGSLLNLVQSDSDTAGLYNYIGFSDKTATWQAYVGYPSGSSGTFTINNSKQGDINLVPKTGNNAKVNGSTIVTESRSVLTGNGLTGGGSLASDRTLAVDFAGTGSANTVARSDHNHDTKYAPIASPTFTGTTTSPNIRLTSTTDASLTSTGHAFQIGADTGLNLIIDSNEIIGRNNGVASTVGINLDGGDVSVGDSSSNLTLNGATTLKNNLYHLGSHYLRANTGSTDSPDLVFQQGDGTTENGRIFADASSLNISAGTSSNAELQLSSTQFVVNPDLVLGSHIYFNNAGSLIFSGLSAGFDQIWFNDTDNSYHFVGDGASSKLTGNASLKAKEFLPTSDIALKTNIADYTESALDKINSVSVKTYNFKDELETERLVKPLHIGLIAQESPKEIVGVDEKTIDLYAMSSVLWKAVQELSIGNVELKTENSILKEKVSEHQVEINILKERISKLEEKLS